VIPDWDEKQISAEATFDTDILDDAQLRAELAQLADRTASRLRSQGWLAEVIVLKVRRSDFKTSTRQYPMRPPSQQTRAIATAAAYLLTQWRKEEPRAAVRLLGVAARHLTTAPQLDMFAAPQAARERHLDSTIDGIRAKFGNSAVGRASSLAKPKLSD
jgi:DNA polymerase-4